MKALLVILLLIQVQFAQAEYLSVAPVVEPDRPRGTTWIPLLSFILPGFGQYYEHQWTSGLTYSAVGATGLGLVAAASSAMDPEDLDGADIDEQTGLERQYTYGSQLYMFAGEMSAYHAFRTAVETRRPYGEYAFIREMETSADLGLAPFDMTHLLRPTTFIPLLLLAGLGAAGLDQDAYLDFGDSAFTAGISYNAGVGEEALFRGYFMPSMRQGFGSNFWSNTIQAILFGAAHYSNSNRLPLAQTLMGFYLGWMTQKNGWSVRQAVFVHTWWDVLAIGLSIAEHNGRSAVARPIPLINLNF